MSSNGNAVRDGVRGVAERMTRWADAKPVPLRFASTQYLMNFCDELAELDSEAASELSLVCGSYDSRGLRIDLAINEVVRKSEVDRRALTVAVSIQGVVGRISVEFAAERGYPKVMNHTGLESVDRAIDDLLARHCRPYTRAQVRRRVPVVQAVTLEELIGQDEQRQIEREAAKVGAWWGGWVGGALGLVTSVAVALLDKS